MFEDFDSYPTGSIVPTCWARIVPASSAGSQTISSATPASGTRNIYQYTSSTATPVIVVLPEFSNINAGTHWIRFKARVSSTGGALEVGYVTDPADAATFTVISTLLMDNTTYTAPDAEKTVVVPSSVPANARLAIRNSSDAKSYYWDDVYWEAVPTCFAPSAISTSGISTTSAMVSWTAPTPAPGTGYTVYYSTANTAPTAATVLDATNSVTSTTTSATISGLAPSTTYYVWVRSNCSTTDSSTWTAGSSFTTLCTAFAAPFTESFSSGSLPNCWTSANPTTTSTSASAFWKFSGAPGYGATNNGRPAGTYAWVDASSPYTGEHTVQLITPQIDLTGVANPYVSFEWFKNHLTSATGTLPAYDNNKLLVHVTTDGTTWTQIFADDTNSSSWRVVGIPLGASYAGATIQVRFTVDKDVSTNGYFYDDLLLDEIAVLQDPTLSTNDVIADAKEVSIYPNPFTDVVNITDVKNLKSVTVVDMSGRMVKSIASPGRQINLGELKAGLYILKLDYKDGTVKTVKAIKK
jgi:hypothetical protein